jgi:DNA polymerase III delta subunit
MAKVSFDASLRVVALIGDDAFLSPYYTRQLIDALEKVHGEIERFDFDGDSASPADVLDELRTYGLLQQHKIVIVDKADRFLAARGEGSGPSRARALLEKYVASPCADATLLLRADTWHRGKIDKAIDQVGLVHRIKPLGPADTLRWVYGRVGKQHGAEIERGAAERLVRRVGCNLARLDSELAKLAAMSPDGTPIDTKLVDEAVPLSREEKAWVIQDALLAGGAARGLTTVHELLGVSRQSDVLVAWAVTDMLRRLHAAARMRQSGAGPQQIRKDLKLWGPAGDATISVAGRVSPERLAHLLGDALRHQQRLRQGLGKADRMLDVMIVEIAEALAA